MIKKVSNPRISNELHQELCQEPAFADAKAFAATHAFLHRVAKFSKDQPFALLPAKTIKDLFGNYSKKYKHILGVLVNHEIIKIDRQYIVGVKPRGYQLTDKGVRLLTSCEQQYLHKLFTDAGLRRKLQKRKSHRRNAVRYSNAFFEYLSSSMIEYTFSRDAIEHVQNSDWPETTKLHAWMSLTDWADCKFRKLKVNETDGRVWNEFVGMKSELRQFFSYGKLKYRYVMDIRSCHPLFLAHYLVYEAKELGYKGHHPMLPGPHQNTIVRNDQLKKQSEQLQLQQRTEKTIIKSTANTTPIATRDNHNQIPTKSKGSCNTGPNNNLQSHYDGVNLDIIAELNRWNALFCDPTTDPKAVLVAELGYTREAAKSALNQTINGSERYAKFYRWFREKYPLLHDVWQRTDIQSVGNEIAAFYETRLMTDMGLYRMAAKLGLHLTYEYDGCGIMCRDDDKDVLGKIQQLIAYVKDRSQIKYQIKPVFVIKNASGEVVASGSLPQGSVAKRTLKPTPPRERANQRP